MNKAELIAKIVADTGITKTAAGEVLASISTTAHAELSTEGEFSLPGIGKLKVTHREARTGHNPKTGAPVDIPARASAKLVVAKELKDALNV